MVMRAKMVYEFVRGKDPKESLNLGIYKKDFKGLIDFTEWFISILPTVLNMQNIPEDIIDIEFYGTVIPSKYNQFYWENDWIVVKNYDEFVQYILLNGLPDFVSFDHDLGIEHIKYYFDNGGHENPPDPMGADFEEKTGYDCAKWLVDYCLEHNLKLPEYLVHSANPIGKKNIISYLENFKKVNEQK
jgi:hypothetical protein